MSMTQHGTIERNARALRRAAIRELSASMPTSISAFFAELFGAKNR